MLSLALFLMLMTTLIRGRGAGLGFKSLMLMKKLVCIRVLYSITFFYCQVGLGLFFGDTVT